jgi:hypothetical protein
MVILNWEIQDLVLPMRTTRTYGRYVITNNPSSVDATYFINGTDHTQAPVLK